MSSSTTSASSTTASSHKNGAFDMDENAIFRAIIVIGGIGFIIVIYCLIKCCRSNASRSRVRKYDLMSAKDLQRTALAVDSDSEDDLFEAPSSDRQKLVVAGSS
ncbi:unnamed protein product [Nippostrongylus brasiliensis]|uniref:Type III endosome membrane protein TEMP n=1 Tax=Nippostrongylus brasiliensis TaxID=27835 RepID=A0A0N4YE39_NIPBR|nr:unnamed protein product [Nippostrongylus brasiliensis]